MKKTLVTQEVAPIIINTPFHTIFSFTFWILFHEISNGFNYSSNGFC